MKGPKGPAADRPDTGSLSSIGLFLWCEKRRQEPTSVDMWGSGMDQASGALEADLDQLRELISTSENIVVFTGAGISTECGIPDFRGPGGLWTNNMPIQFQDFVASEDMRREAWRRKFAMEDVFRAARPGPAHLSVARLAATGRLRQVTTQNIDNMHQLSGVPEALVVELHGNGSYATCLACGLRHELDDVRADFEVSGHAPHCRACGGLVKTATISFGQAMPEEAMERASRAAAGADLYLVFGSSLTVWPAAGLPLAAKQAGADLVIINAEPTELDSFADILIDGNLSELLPRIIL